jgi:hypothetical protein
MTWEVAIDENLIYPTTAFSTMLPLFRYVQHHKPGRVMTIEYAGDKLYFIAYFVLCLDQNISIPNFILGISASAVFEQYLAAVC